MKKIVTLIALATVALSAQAVEKPTTEEVKKVLDFYYMGQGQGIVLVESKLCLEVEKEGVNKNNCVDDAALTSLSADQPVNLWMSFLVPSSDPEQKVILQFEHNGIARIVKEVSVSGSVRYRTWRLVELNKPGAWTIKIIHDHEDDVEVLSTMNVSVVEAPSIEEVQ